MQHLTMAVIAVLCAQFVLHKYPERVSKHDDHRLMPINYVNVTVKARAHLWLIRQGYALADLRNVSCFATALIIAFLIAAQSRQRS